MGWQHNQLQSPLGTWPLPHTALGKHGNHEGFLPPRLWTVNTTAVG